MLTHHPALSYRGTPTRDIVAHAHVHTPYPLPCNRVVTHQHQARSSNEISHDPRPRKPHPRTSTRRSHCVLHPPAQMPRTPPVTTFLASQIRSCCRSKNKSTVWLPRDGRRSSLICFLRAFHDRSREHTWRQASVPTVRGWRTATGSRICCRKIR